MKELPCANLRINPWINLGFTSALPRGSTLELRSAPGFNPRANTAAAPWTSPGSSLWTTLGTFCELQRPASNGPTAVPGSGAPWVLWLDRPWIHPWTHLWTCPWTCAWIHPWIRPLDQPLDLPLDLPLNPHSEPTLQQPPLGLTVEPSVDP